jgi:hypothetical protein
LSQYESKRSCQQSPWNISLARSIVAKVNRRSMQVFETGQTTPDSVAGLTGFELPEDDSSSSRSTAGERPATLDISRQIRQRFQLDGQTPSGGSNPLTPGIRAGLAALVGRAACANCDSVTILMGEVMLQQHETIVAPEHPISDKKGRDAKRPRSSYQSMQQRLTNFGIGALAAQSSDIAFYGRSALYRRPVSQ